MNAATTLRTGSLHYFTFFFSGLDTLYDHSLETLSPQLSTKSASAANNRSFTGLHPVEGVEF